MPLYDCSQFIHDIIRLAACTSDSIQQRPPWVMRCLWQQAAQPGAREQRRAGTGASQARLALTGLAAAGPPGCSAACSVDAVGLHHAAPTAGAARWRRCATPLRDHRPWETCTEVIYPGFLREGRGMRQLRLQRRPAESRGPFRRTNSSSPRCPHAKTDWRIAFCCGQGEG